MTPVQEMVTTLVSFKIIQQVKDQFKSRKEIISIEEFDMPFRLFRVDDETINLELMLSRRFGPISRETGIALQAVSTYFKPIGVYKLNQHSGEFHIIILNEFEDEYHRLARSGVIKNEYEIDSLSLEENAVIAAFSMDAIIEARDKRDKRGLKINGLDVEIFMAHDGYPQMFLHDKYRLSGPVGAYFINGPQSLNPMISNKDIFDDLLSRSLLSVYKAM